MGTTATASGGYAKASHISILMKVIHTFECSALSLYIYSLSSVDRVALHYGELGHFLLHFLKTPEPNNIFR